MTCPCVHLFSFSVKVIPAKQATGQDHLLFSELKERLARSNYRIALLTFTPPLSNRIENPLWILKRTSRSIPMMITPRLIKSPLKNLNDPFKNDRNGHTSFQLDSDKTLPTFQST